jgi:hypothetical protein
MPGGGFEEGATPVNEELTRRLERRRSAVSRDAVSTVRSEFRKVLAGFLLHVLFAAAVVWTHRSGGLSALLPDVQPEMMEAGLAIGSLLFGLLCWSATYRVARDSGSKAPVLWTLAMMVPGLNVVTLGLMTLVVGEFGRKRALR